MYSDLEKKKLIKHFEEKETDLHEDALVYGGVDPVLLWTKRLSGIDSLPEIPPARKFGWTRVSI